MFTELEPTANPVINLIQNAKYLGNGIEFLETVFIVIIKRFFLELFSVLKLSFSLKD
jgi:hypothetical protein